MWWCKKSTRLIETCHFISVTKIIDHPWAFNLNLTLCWYYNCLRNASGGQLYNMIIPTLYFVYSGVDKLLLWARSILWPIFIWLLGGKIDFNIRGCGNEEWKRPLDTSCSVSGPLERIRVGPAEVWHNALLRGGAPHSVIPWSLLIGLSQNPMVIVMWFTESDTLKRWIRNDRF